MSNDVKETTETGSPTQCGWCGAPLADRYVVSPSRLLVTFGPKTEDRRQMHHCVECWEDHVGRIHQPEKRNWTWTRSDDDHRAACGWCGGPVACREPAGTSLEVVFEDQSESTWARHETQYCQVCVERHVQRAQGFMEAEESGTEDAGGDGA